MTTLAIGFLVFGTLVVGSNFLVRSSIQTIGTQWGHFEKGPSRKSALLNDLRGAIGLGGVVHQFQSFILRKDRILLVNIHSALREATVAIIAYEALDINQSESEALNLIKTTLLQYRNNVELIERLAAENKQADAIDQMISIDDEPALRGLAALDAQIDKMRNASAVTIFAAMDKVDRTTFVSSALTLLLVVSFALLITMTLRHLLRQIGGEPSRILDVVRRIADGDLSEDLSPASVNSHGIYKAMAVMQTNLKQQIESEKKGAKENSQLRQALDHASSNVIVVNAQHEVIYVNESARALFSIAEDDVSHQVIGFVADQLKGFDIGEFKTVDGSRLNSDAVLYSNQSHELSFGSRTFSVLASTINSSGTEYIGSVLEWTDRTTEIDIQMEIQAVVEAASAGDLSQRIDIAGKSGFFAMFSEGMNELIMVNEAIVNDVQRVLESMANGNLDIRLERSYTGAFARLKENVNSTVEQLSQMIDDLKSGSNALSKSSEHVISIGDELGRTVKNSSQQASEAAAAASTVSDSIDTVAAVTVEMSESTKGITNNVSDAVNVAREAVVIAQRADKYVSKLIDSSEAIGGVTKVITSIAEQTNLLALNATIESARAGESGKGFAVVANEVKELAKETAKATEEIDNKIRSIQSDTEGVVAAIREIAGIVNQINTFQESVVMAVEEQRAATEEITRSIQTAASGSAQIATSVALVAKDSQSVRASADQASSAARELDALSATLNNLTNHFKLSSALQLAGNVNPQSASSVNDPADWQNYAGPSD